MVQDDDGGPPPSITQEKGRSRVARIWVFVIGAGVLAAAVVVGGLIGKQVDGLLDVRHIAREALSGQLLVVLLIVYVVLTALPFVPGAEIGLALLVVLGADAAGLVYGATVAALILAFCVGRLVPQPLLEHGFARAGLASAAGLMRESRDLAAAARSQHFAARLPTRWLPWLMRHRLCTLAVLVNTPGNTLLGGGGGIAMATGASRTVSPLEFVPCVALAVAPVPLAFVLLG